MFGTHVKYRLYQCNFCRKALKYNRETHEREMHGANRDKLVWSNRIRMGRRKQRALPWFRLLPPDGK